MSRHLSTLLRVSFLVLAAVELRVTAGEHQAQTASTQTGSVPKIAIERHTLSNGLQLILHVDRKLPVVHVNQWFNVVEGRPVPRK
jgi:zinc protease